MESNLNNKMNPENEIDLRDIFLSLWRQKLLIISITLIAAIMAGLFSVFLISPVYHSKLNIIINMPEIYNTKYGDYTLPLTTNDQYINLITSSDILVNTMKDMEYDSKDMTIEGLRDKITISKPTTASGNVKQNSFEVKVAASNPEEARRLAQTLYNNYIEFLDVMIADGAVEYYTNYYNVQLRTLKVELESNQELLKKYEALLADTPLTINQKEAMNSLQGQVNTRDFVILENIINPNYTELELDIIESKQTIYSLENNMNMYQTYLDELDAMQLKIEEYYRTGVFTDLQSNIVSVTKANVYLPSEPVAPSSKTSPNIVKNVIIGSLLGGMASVLIALIKEFWLKKE